MTHHRRTHGHTSKGVVSPTYRSWQVMLQRVNNPNSRNQASLAARNITVDPRWAQFDTFLADMGPRPEGLVLRRKNPHLGFYPTNCEWGPHPIPTLITSARAKELNKLSQGKARVHSKRGRPRERDSILSLARKAGIHPSTVYARLRAGWSRRMAAEVPVRPHKSIQAILAGTPNENSEGGNRSRGSTVETLPEICSAPPQDGNAPEAQGGAGDMVVGVQTGNKSTQGLTSTP